MRGAGRKSSRIAQEESDEHGNERGGKSSSDWR